MSNGKHRLTVAKLDSGAAAYILSDGTLRTCDYDMIRTAVGHLELGNVWEEDDA